VNDLPFIDWQSHDQRNLIRFFKDLLQQAGLPNIRFHDLRHTATTLMLLNGISLIVVSRRLGYSKASVTLDIYGHYLPGMQKEAAAMMDDLANPHCHQMVTDWQPPGESHTRKAQFNRKCGGH